MHTYRGNIHIHSCYSDGTGSMEKIAEAAASADLDYIVVTDHETVAGLKEEAIYKGVVVLVGSEINRKHSHYLAFNIDQTIESNEDNPQEVIDQVSKAGGFGAIAHPFEKGSAYIEKGKAYPWIKWPVFRFQGLEIWNYTSHWRGRFPSSLKTLYCFFLNRSAAMDGPSPDCLKLWDCYNRYGHRIFGIGGSDAHASLYRLGPLKVTIFTYNYIFRTINTYIYMEEELSSDFPRAKDQIYKALQEGHSFLSYDILHPAAGFLFYGLSNDRIILPGSELDYEENIELRIKSPYRRSLIRVILDGKLFLEAKTDDISFKPAVPGVYRVEVYYRPLIGHPRPWIYANPIYVKTHFPR
ncbi:MAG: hypothetical protein AVO34_01215 [Firmicutes bacterium ML8_F2]|jgi:hypothetical protein|nr:MAG: hypothetical protein AVO34_01215 [Firmicutes bacterium ML8_F2]